MKYLGAISDSKDLVNKGYVDSHLVYYGVCSDGTNVVNKVVTVDNSFTLATGARVYVYFSGGYNTASNPTLNVNSTGAIAIKTSSTNAPGTTQEDSWNSSSIIQFIYTGTYWMMVDFQKVPSLSTSDMQAGTSTNRRTITALQLKNAIAYWNYRMELDSSEALYTAINNLGWTSAVIE